MTEVGNSTSNTQEIPLILTVNNHATLDNSSFDTVCNSCLATIYSNDANYVPQREDLRTFLSKSFEGIEILTYYDLHKSLADDLHAPLTQLLMSREFYIMSKMKKFSASNLFKKIE